MNELIQQLVSKVGLDEATATKVVEFLKEHADEIPGWLGQAGLGDLMGKAKGLFGG